MFLATRRALVVVVAAVVAVPLGTAALARSDVKRYVVPERGGYGIRPLLSVGERRPVTGERGARYQMVGIPDGLGLRHHGPASTLYMNHEFDFDALSEPILGAPLYRGAIVSKLRLARDGDVRSGDVAFDETYLEDKFVGPTARANNDTPAFGRFCSGFLALPAQTGFDRPIYFANEETEPEESFDGKGGLSVAIFNGEAHGLPKLGHMLKENSVVMPDTGNETVIVSLEDQFVGQDAQLWLYVGHKERGADSVLSRNGLDNGKLYVFVSSDPDLVDESTFTGGSITGEWVEIPNAEDLTDPELEAAADARGAFSFVRIEDGAFSRTSNRDFFFDTTGGSTEFGNILGRLYHLRLDANDPIAEATLKIVYNADEIVHEGGDIALSPDNLDVTRSYLMVQEDPTDPARLVLAALERDSSVWRFRLDGGRWVDVSSATRVAEVNPPGRDGIAVLPGVWETSGIVDASSAFAGDSWLLDVQAHPPTTPPGVNTVEDGQLALMRRR
jgi:hypothetical protein